MILSDFDERFQRQQESKWRFFGCLSGHRGFAWFLSDRQKKGGRFKADRL